MGIKLLHSNGFFYIKLSFVFGHTDFYSINGWSKCDKNITFILNFKDNDTKKIIYDKIILDKC